MLLASIIYIQKLGRVWEYEIYSCLVTKSCLTLLWPIDCNPQGSWVPGISQSRILECVAISFSRGSSQPLDQSHFSYIVRQVLYHWATWQAQSIPFVSLQNLNTVFLLWTLPGFQHLQQWSELEGMWSFGSQPRLPVAPEKLLPAASVHTPLPGSDQWVWNIAMALTLF